MTQGKYFYRFRSIENLIGRGELENSTIYFASPEELNDPMEGYRDLFFEGDIIVWKNLFRHYLLCLDHVYSIMFIAGEKNADLSEKSLPIHCSIEDLGTEVFKTRFESLNNKFQEECKDLIEKITKRETKIRRDELSYYFDNIHHLALDLIDETYENKGSSKSKKMKSKYSFSDVLSLASTTLDLLPEVKKQTKKENTEDIMFNIMSDINKEMKLHSRCRLDIENKTPNKNFILYEFTEAFVNSLEKLMYPTWYTACFMSEGSINNSSVWGSYASNHKGVCLIFEPNTNDDDKYFNITKKVGIGSSGYIYGPRTVKLQKINYDEGYAEIDFFKSIGNLSSPKLMSTWYIDAENNLSSCAKDIVDDKGNWRENHWKTFYKDLFVKTKDWKYENEYRVIINELDHTELEKKDKTIEYDFNHLKGIIFGIRTSTETKLKILDIIDKKLEDSKRVDFKFFQAYYSHEDKEIKHKELTFFNREK